MIILLDWSLACCCFQHPNWNAGSNLFIAIAKLQREFSTGLAIVFQEELYVFSIIASLSWVCLRLNIKKTQKTTIAKFKKEKLRQNSLCKWQYDLCTSAVFTFHEIPVQKLFCARLAKRTPISFHWWSYSNLSGLVSFTLGVLSSLFGHLSGVRSLSCPIPRIPGWSVRTMCYGLDMY